MIGSGSIVPTVHTAFESCLDGDLVEVSIFPGIFLGVISLVMCSNHVMLALC